MSIFSKILNKVIKAPEVDLSKLPIGTQLVNELIFNGVKQAFKPLNDSDMKILDKAVQVEMYHRKIKAGIGVAYDTNPD
jgi:hypothetical protein